MDICPNANTLDDNWGLTVGGSVLLFIDKKGFVCNKIDFLQMMHCLQ